MTVAQIVSGRGHDGATGSCADICIGLAERGHRVVLVHRPGAWVAAQVDHPRVERIESGLRRTPGEVWRLAGALRARSVDVIHTHMSSANSYGMILRILGFRRVTTAQASLFQPHWFFNDRVIAPAPAVADFHHRYNLVPRRRIVLIPNFVDVGRFRPAEPAARAAKRAELGLAPGDFAILSVGSVVERKRADDLAAAFLTVHARFPQARLFFAGQEHHPFNERVRAVLAPVGDAARFLGARDDVPALLGAADVFCSSSGWEAGPLSVIEAMASGLPVVSTRWGSVETYMAEEETGFVVAIGDVAGLADRLSRLAAAPELAARMGAAGRARAASEFAKDDAIDRIAAVLAEAARTNYVWG